MRVSSRSRLSRWTEECTAILLELSACGCTDQEIADGIERRTGLRFHRNRVLQERRDRMIGPYWQRVIPTIALSAAWNGATQVTEPTVATFRF